MFLPGSGGFLNPADIVKEFKIKKDSIIADFGCGAGYFSIPLARETGPEGKVYAIDIRKEALESVRSMSAAERLRNIVIVWGDLEEAGGSKLPDEFCDSLILANILYLSSRKELIMKEALRVLKKEGRVFIVDWRKEAPTVGPQEGYRLTQEEARQLADGAGLKFLREIDVGKYHFGQMYEK